MDDDTTLTVVEMKELYNSWKKFVWVIRIKHTTKGKNLETVGTAFTVNSDGLMLTSAHFFPRTTCRIDVRRLDEVYFHSAKVVYEKPKWDVALLQVADVSGCHYATLSNDAADVNGCHYATLSNHASLSVGQTLLHIGNPKNFVGSFLVGKVAFDCIDDVNVKIPVSGVTCKDYTPTAVTTTPKYRIMGDICNEDVLHDSSSDKISFEKNLHPFVPIIQMYGLICGTGCSGGPVFNVRGEVVGMVALSVDNYEIAIHVAILREIIRLFKEQHPDDEDGKRKDITDPKVQGGDSKKFKALLADRKGKGVQH